MVSMLAVALSGAWAQDSSTPDEAVPQSGQTQQPVPAYGQEGTPPPIAENPPLSGMDLPALEPHAAPLSYLQPGATVSESADTNIGNNVGGGASVHSVSRALGSLTLRRLWSHYDLAVDYTGGVGYYQLHGIGWKQLQDLGLDQKIAWKRGQLSVRDSFSYLPEGNFGDAYGSLGSVGVTNISGTAFGSFWGGTALGSLGVVPRILNVSLADVTENLTPRSAVTAAGGYAFTHFYGNDFNGNAFIDSSQVSAQSGYNRLLTSHTQVAIVYGYQSFDFSVVGTAFHTHVVQGMYGHRITGRMDLLVGAGPQFTQISVACSPIDQALGNPHCQTVDQNGNPVGSIPDTKIGVAGQARLRYRFPRTSLDIRFERFETSGGGLFAGAQSNIARLTVDRPLSRVWSATADLGYAHNSRIQSLTAAQIGGCIGSQGSQNACPANDAKTYSYGFAGAALHRHFGRSFHGFLSYQDNELSFDHSFCASKAPCSRISNRQVVTLGLDWTPRPIRLD